MRFSYPTDEITQKRTPKFMLRLTLPLLLGISLLLTACTTQITMLNPATIHCAEQGGQIELAISTQEIIGLCAFADGSVCDEWAFLDGSCVPGQNVQIETEETEKPAEAQSGAGLANPASVNCLDQDGFLFIVQARDGGEYGMCQLPSGKFCEEWALFREECQP